MKVSCSNVIFASFTFSGWISGTICFPSGDFSSLYVSSSFSLSVRASVVIADAETLKVKALFDVLWTLIVKYFFISFYFFKRNRTIRVYQTFRICVFESRYNFIPQSISNIIKPAPCCLGDAKYWLFSFQEVASIIGRAVFCRAIFVRLVRSILSSP